MRYYCPGCWKDFWNEDFEVCPECGYNAKAHNDKDYVDKLLSALNHPAGDVKHWVIMILVQRKEKRAISYLEKLKRQTKDPSLVKGPRRQLLKLARVIKVLPRDRFSVTYLISINCRYF